MNSAQGRTYAVWTVDLGSCIRSEQRDTLCLMLDRIVNSICYHTYEYIDLFTYKYSVMIYIPVILLFQMDLKAILS